MLRKHLKSDVRRELMASLGVSDWEIGVAESQAGLRFYFPDMADPESDDRCFEITFMSPKLNREVSIIFRAKHFEWEDDEEERPLPPEPGCWNPWPDSEPSDNSPMLVKYNVGNRTKYAVGRYEHAYSQWVFDDIFGQYATVITKNSVLGGTINSVFYQPVEERHEIRQCMLGH